MPGNCDAVCIHLSVNTQEGEAGADVLKFDFEQLQGLREKLATGDRQVGESKIRTNATQAEPRCQFRRQAEGQSDVGLCQIRQHFDAISAPAGSLCAIQVWYKVETNCCGVGN